MADENITNDTIKNTDSCESTADVQMDMFSDTWGFSLEDLYKIAITFYKGLYILFRIVECSSLVYSMLLFTSDCISVFHIC